MASAHQRGHQKKPGGKWTAKYKDRHGAWRYKVGFTSKSLTLELARKLENEEALIREGIVDARDSAAKEAAKRPLAKHIEDYHAELTARGNCKEHCADTVSLIKRLLAGANIGSITAINSDRVRVQLGRIAKARSASTANHAQRAVKSFTRWLTDGKRLKEDPMLSLRSTYNEDADRKRVRRPLTPEQVAALIDTARDAPPIRKRNPRLPVSDNHSSMTGPDRSALYLVATLTGFRASELRSLTPEDFDLGENPAVTVRAAYSKNGKTVTQPIRRSEAESVARWLDGREPGKSVFADMPFRTAEMLAVDLERIGIPVRTSEGVCDFHSLRMHFITYLGRSGADPETMRVLARHAKFETTQRYLKTDDETKRKAVEGTTEPPKSVNTDVNTADT